jgi:hypothetical protein
MAWEVEVTNEFKVWFASLNERQQEAVTDRVDLLAEQGPALRRPVVGDIEGSRHENMKELRASSDGHLRVLFMFDPRKQIIFLIGGDKTGRWKEWYDEMIPVGDDLYDEYLQELRNEGLIE